jgi:hypothetical protein
MMFRSGSARRFVTFVAALSCLIGAVLLVGRYIDAVRWDHGTLLDVLRPGSGNSARYALTASVAALATTLGILMGWVLLSVNMAASRYSLRIVDRFTHSRATRVMGGLFVATILYCIWVELTIEDDFIPRWGLLSALGLVSLCLSLLGPYFYYLLALLQPGYLVDELAQDLRATIRPAHRPAQRRAAPDRMRAGLAQLAEIALSALQTGDRALARRAVWAVAQTLVAYQQHKHELHGTWLTPPAPSAEDHLTYRSEAVLFDAEAWLEEAGLYELRRVFEASLGRAPDVAGTVAHAVRELGVAALDASQDTVAHRATSYLNSYLRSCLNRRDVTAAYTLLQQYRLFAEGALLRDASLAHQIVQHFVYYGRQAEGMGLDWITITAAYDLRSLCQQASQVGVDGRELLTAYRDLVSPLTGRSVVLCRELTKNAALLASFYLLAGDMDSAGRLEAVLATASDPTRDQARDDLLAVNTPAYWEVTERGINFDYASQAQRGILVRLLGALPGSVEPSATSHSRAD